MSPKKDPDVPKKPGPNIKSSGVKTPFTRRGLLSGRGIGSGAIGTGILTTGLAEPAEAATGMGPGAVPVTLKINGKDQSLTIEPRVTLCDALRNRLDMTGAKRVCDRGTCGACTVIMNGKVVYSCTVLAIDAQGKDIQTIEGIGTPAKPHPVSLAFVNNDAQQCGYCTPGFVMAAKGVLDRHPNPGDVHDVARRLSGHLWRLRAR